MPSPSAPPDRVCEELYAAFGKAGVETLYDDREERAGTKFATADLMGAPWRITVGPRGLKDGVVELTSRRTGEAETVSPEAALDRMKGIFAGL